MKTKSRISFTLVACLCTSFDAMKDLPFPSLQDIQAEIQGPGFSNRLSPFNAIT